MTDKLIRESGMVFGPYRESHCFHIEKSGVYGKINCHGVKMVEFILLRTDNSGRQTLWIVEAKSSSRLCVDKESIDEIKDKFVNALALGWAYCLRRHDETGAELPTAFRMIDLGKVDVKFVLVINGHKKSWLDPLRDALEKALRVTQKTWNFSPNYIAVLNEEGARRHSLIQATA